jgi:hypothetical protein
LPDIANAIVNGHWHIGTDDWSLYLS